MLDTVLGNLLTWNSYNKPLRQNFHSHFINVEMEAQINDLSKFTELVVELGLKPWTFRV